ncbi:MAG: helix-turn-helix transcriptional regulator [Fimbriimonadales bacterium]|nr:helix-turn-helix transcriptional regulator [Fimbriimonadales bacterium]
MLEAWSIEAPVGAGDLVEQDRPGFVAWRTFEGRGRLEFRDGRVLEVPPASLIVARAALLERWQALAPGWRCWRFHFCCLGPLDAPVERPMPIAEHARDGEDFATLVAGLGSPSRCQRQWASAAFAGMFWRWVAGWCGRWSVPSSHAKVAAILERVYERIGDEWTVARLATEEGVSERYLNQLFREVVGESPKRFLNRLRLLTAEQMLRFGRLSMREVALEMGFASPSHFSTAFRSFFGESPREYLRRVRSSGCAVQAPTEPSGAPGPSV